MLKMIEDVQYNSDVLANIYGFVLYGDDARVFSTPHRFVLKMQCPEPAVRIILN
jgi:hypothetical protein